MMSEPAPQGSTDRPEAAPPEAAAAAANGNFSTVPPEAPSDEAAPSTLSQDVGRSLARQATASRSVSWPVLSDYEIVEELGSGGMGFVYKAKQKRLHRDVALKVIRPELRTRSDVLNRFLKEAMAHAQLKHPNIVVIHDYVEENGVQFFVMEYVEGIDLHKWVAASGRLTGQMACNYVRQVAEGLQHLHVHGLVHRDIKPSNLMHVLANQTGGNTPADTMLNQSVIKILDLGLARLSLTSADQQASSDGNEGPVGTPDFMAPEQAVNAAKADIRSDLYSLGCTMYYLLTAEVPFPGGSKDQKMCQQRLAEPPPVTQFRQDLLPEVVSMLRKLMAKDPGDRYQTPMELVKDLDALSRREAQSSLESYYVESNKAKASSWRPHRGAVRSVAFSRSGKHALSGSEDNTVRLWDVDTGQVLQRFRRHQHGVLSTAFLADDRHVMSACSNHVLWRWDRTTGCEVQFQQLPEPLVRSELRFSRDGRLAAWSDADHSIFLWDVAKNCEVRRLAGHKDEVRALAFSHHADLLVSGAADATTRVWELSTGRQLHCFVPSRSWFGRILGQNQDPVVTCVAISADGRQVLSGTSNNSVLLWDLPRNRLAREFTGHKDRVTCVCFSPDERHFLSGSWDRSVRFWDLANNSELTRFEGHKDSVTCVACAAHHGLSGSKDRTVRLWKLPL